MHYYRLITPFCSAILPVMPNPEFSREEEDGLLDPIDDATTRLGGQTYARLLARDLTERGIILPSAARYLAIGAGQAIGELEFARELEVPESQVTLLDKTFSPKALRRFRDINFLGERKKVDIFHFLNEPLTRKYDLVSAMSMEYVFNSPERTEQLVAGLTSIMNQNGVALIIPARTRVDMTPVWNKYGFSSLSPNSPSAPSHYAMIYRLPVKK